MTGTLPGRGKSRLVHVYDERMGQQRRPLVTADDYGERRIDLYVFSRTTWGRQPRCHWHLSAGDPYTEHDVTVGALPEGHPAGRWYVLSTHHADVDPWTYPTTAGALWRVAQLRAARPEYVWEPDPDAFATSARGQSPAREGGDGWRSLISSRGSSTN